MHAISPLCTLATRVPSRQSSSRNWGHRSELATSSLGPYTDAIARCSTAHHTRSLKFLAVLGRYVYLFNAHMLLGPGKQCLDVLVHIHRSILPASAKFDSETDNKGHAGSLRGKAHVCKR